MPQPPPPPNPPAAPEPVAPEVHFVQEETVIAQDADTEMRHMKALPRKKLAARARTSQAGSVPQPTVYVAS